jgi:hypothetical protein
MTRMTGWLDQRIEAINMCIGAGFAEAALALLYSAIDTLAFLSAPANAKKAERRHFINWCNLYIVPLPNSAATGIDLYGARCGILHTSSAASELGCEGKAREVWYQFKGRAGVNLMTNTPRPALILDIPTLVEAFTDGSRRFATDLESDHTRLATTEQRVAQFFSWGVLANRYAARF